MGWNAIIPAAITGILTGGAASLIAPWINWGVEKHKYRRIKREELIESFKEALKEENYQLIEFRDSEIFIYLEPFLNSELQRKISEHKANQIIVIGNPMKGEKVHILDYRRDLLKAVVELEKKWKLI